MTMMMSLLCMQSEEGKRAGFLFKKGCNKRIAILLLQPLSFATKFQKLTEDDEEF